MARSSPIEKTEAIVLRVYPYSNSSRIVAWLTPGFGRITTLIKGLQRVKSDFIGQYDLFYTCELLFYDRAPQQLKIARSCAPLKMRSSFRSNWKASAAASYLADLAFRIHVPDAPHTGLFALLDHALDQLDTYGVDETFLYWYELRILQLHGLAPQLRQCLRCGASLTAPTAGIVFSYVRGGILCRRCAKETGDAAARIQPDVLATLRAWQQAKGPEITRRTRCTALQLNTMEGLLGLFVSYHLDLPLTSRRIALDTLSRRVA